MNFKQWLHEGFGVDYDNLPNAFRPDSFDATSISAQSGRQKLVGQIYDSNSINFDPEDRPQDFIKINSINQLSKFDPPQPLKSFEGSEILYGMTFDAKSNLLSQEFSKNVKFLKEELKKLMNLKRENDKNGKEPVQNIVFDTYKDIVDKGGDSTTIEKRLPQMAQARIAAAGLANKTNQTWNLQKMLNIVKSMKTKPEEKVSVSELNKQIQDVKSKLEVAVEKLNATPRMSFIIQQAFLRKIKHPKTPEDHQLCDHFVKLSVDNYTKFRGQYHYDYVLYPESSSELNENIAKSLAAKYGATPIRGFQKIENPKIDTTSFINKYPGKPNEPDDNGVMRSGYWRTFQNLKNTVDRSKGQIKNIQKNQPFVRNLQMDPTIPQQVTPQDQRSQLRNRRLLVIDDNTRSGGTFQIINHILRDQGPQSIHYYTPLLANFTYGTGKETTELPKQKRSPIVIK